MALCYSCKTELTHENLVKNAGKGVGREGCCKQCNTKRVSEWYFANKDKKRAYDEKRREEKRHLYREAGRRFAKNNPAKVKAGTIERRQGIKQRTPAWANMAYMNLFYKIAKLEQERTGRKVHVDHIYPLKSSWVCGLHNEHNMQLLFAEDNIRKGNKNVLVH